MKQKIIRLTCLVTTFIIGGHNICAQMMLPISLSQRTTNAQKIVLGKIVEKQSYWDNTRHNIYTINVMDVNAYLKNDNANNAAQIAIITAGGIVGNEGQITCPSFEFNLNNEYAVFLDADNSKLDNKLFRQNNPAIAQCEAYASSQGVLGYVDGLYYDLMVERPMTEIAFINRMQTEYNLTPTNPKNKNFAARGGITINASTLGTITSWANGGGTQNSTGNYIGATIVANNELIINGNGFGNTAGTVEFDHVNDGVGIGSLMYAATLPSDIISWSDGQIRTKIPSNAGTGVFRVKDNTANVVATAASNINIIWSQVNVESAFNSFATSTRQQAKFINQNTKGGYSFQYSTLSAGGNVFSTNAPAKATFEKALATWRCATLVNINVIAATTSAGLASDDINAVSFAVLSAGVLGGCTTRFTAEASGSCNMFNTVWYVKELDIQLSQDAAGGAGWNFGPGATTGGKIDFESVMLHELGHGNSCAHINTTSTSMYFAIATNTDKRTLSANEITCGDFRVSNSTSNFCTTPTGGKTPMVRISASICANALPLKLIDFSAIATTQNSKNKTLLNWNTVNEYNVAYFELERDNTDGVNFKPIKKIIAANALNQTYETVDENPFLGINYYRLKMVDNDGSFTYSPIKKVIFSTSSNGVFSVYPNPAKKLLSVNFNNNIDNKLYDYTIINLLGQTYIQGKIINNKIDISNLPNGTYILNIGEAKTTFFKYE